VHENIPINTLRTWAFRIFFARVMRVAVELSHTNMSCVWENTVYINGIIYLMRNTYIFPHLYILYIFVCNLRVCIYDYI